MYTRTPTRQVIFHEATRTRRARKTPEIQPLFTRRAHAGRPEAELGHFRH